MTADLSILLPELSAALPGASVAHCRNAGPAGQDSLLVAPESLPAVMRWLRDTPGQEFDFLSNVTGVDWPDPAVAAKVLTVEGADAPAATGFLEVVYHLYSTTRRVGPLVLRARTADRSADVTLPSVTGIFRSADFQEREIFDLFGVVFAGHPDLRRILMWDEFVDHPMRKDYVPPSDHEYEPTPHDQILVLAERHLNPPPATPASNP